MMHHGISNHSHCACHLVHALAHLLLPLASHEDNMTRPGCLLVFGVYLAHRSGPNKTDSPRKAVYLTYNQATEGDLRDHYYGEKRRLFPPISDREEGKDYSEGAVIYNLTTPITEQGLYSLLAFWLMFSFIFGLLCRPNLSTEIAFEQAYSAQC